MRIVVHREARQVVGGLVAGKRLLLCLVLLPSLVATSESAENMSTRACDNTWNWTNQKKGSLGRARLEFTSAGAHRANVRMHEDGFRLNKIALTTDASYRPTDEISQEHPPRDNLHGKVEPNEPGPEEPEPIEVSPPSQPVLDRVLRRTSFDIGPEIYSFKYDEPGFMEEEGAFYGVRLGYTFRDWVPSSPEEAPSGGGTMFRGEARFALGQVDYDGALTDDTPLTIDNIDDFAFEGRLLLGSDWLGGEMLNNLYAGIGYRYLYDDLSSHPTGYRRESNYLYVPLGYRFDGSGQVGWSLGFGAEYDVFITGNQRSYFSDVGLTDMDNRQNSGYGYRASVNLQYKSKDTIFVIEPFFRYWDIDKSETERAFWGSAYEPANETTEYGIQFVWMF